MVSGGQTESGPVLRLVLGDQLSTSLSALEGIGDGDIVFMAEVAAEATYVKHHRKKIAFLFAAMRHFARDLESRGLTVDYTRYGASHGASLETALKAAIARHGASRVIMTEPGEWRVLEMMRNWTETLGPAVELRPDHRFLCSHERFRDWAEGRKSMRMEYFYREMRKQTGYLMRGNGPEGGEWNLDSQNQEPLPDGVTIPRRPDYSVDATTREVIDLVEQEFPDHFGDLEPFNYPVTRRQALHYLDWFVAEALPRFGTFQDAMKQGEPLLFHSHLSALINCGLLDPRECCQRAEHAFHAGDAPLNAVEGFIRQIIGWREFIRGIYWLNMPDYAASNRLHARRALPGFFWTGDTPMNCLAQAIAETRANAYAHHIQRLMVIGNFCLLAGLNPREVQEWYLLVYWDAYEWVEMPNVLGMILWADGGLFASKPYAASGSYIDRMSNYCGACRYKVKKKTGDDACPFNYLYWDFLDRNREYLSGNARMAMMYRTLDRMQEDRKHAFRADSRRFLDALKD
ncbi:MAG: cryptochrome/photolyase family protein [Zhengella sp.]|uniref:cryptochrome/photolyase family protein n=1 Tax=Zhengella sp. TaxID=2282762 RepID=UPI001E1261A9|nr:cryptochrome/photolyase family protein [Notoacmeibacter sp.]MCC0027700.1 cryptochrome/photolyase family protein [Brucellaceae bacterium]